MNWLKQPQIPEEHPIKRPSGPEIAPHEKPNREIMPGELPDRGAQPGERPSEVEPAGSPEIHPPTET